MRCRQKVSRRLKAGTVALLVGAAAIAATMIGCERSKPKSANLDPPPEVQLVQPTKRRIVRQIGQPSFIEAYERTSIFPKVTGYIEKWNVDIGDKVKKGEVLATLYVPELVEDYGTKKATVKLDKERIDLAESVVEVADSDVTAAEAKLEETKSILEKYQADVDRWQSEVERLSKEVKKGVLDPQILLESQNQLKQSTASRTAASASIANAKAEVASRQNTLRKARIDVEVARADLAVAESEEKRLKAWVGYLSLVAPFDGIIEARNANTFDFVSPSTGDPTAMQRGPNLSPQNTAPIYVVDRTDIVRVFVDIPEQDANFVQIGTKANVVARAYRSKAISASVTRTSWALNVKSRTLRAEVDLPNTESQILPGMYAYSTVIIERPGVLALPATALVQDEDQTFCWRYENGQAVWTEVEVGVSDGEWVEIVDWRTPNKNQGHQDTETWESVDPHQPVIVGDLERLSNGMKVNISTSDSTDEDLEDRTAGLKHGTASSKSKTN